MQGTIFSKWERYGIRKVELRISISFCFLLISNWNLKKEFILWNKVSTITIPFYFDSYQVQNRCSYLWGRFPMITFCVEHRSHSLHLKLLAGRWDHGEVYLALVNVLYTLVFFMSLLIHVFLWNIYTHNICIIILVYC